MKKIIGAATAAALTSCLAVAGATGATAAPGDQVEVMPGAVEVESVVLTDENVYAVSYEPGRGDELFARSVDLTESTVTLGASTRVSRIYGWEVAEHEGTLAYVSADTGELTLRAPDGATTTPAFGSDHTYSYGVQGLSSSWVVAGYTLIHRGTGQAHPLEGLPVTTTSGAPAVDHPEDAYIAGGSLHLSETRVMWTVRSWDDAGTTEYEALLVADLNGDGSMGPAVRVDVAVDEPDGPTTDFDSAGLADGVEPVWLRDAWTADGYYSGSTLMWLDGSLAATPTSVVFADEYVTPLEVSGSVVALAVYDYQTGSEEIRWLDLAGDPQVPLRTMPTPALAPMVAHGSLIAGYDVDSGYATWALADADGRTITADQTLPGPVQRFTDVGLDHAFFADIDWLVVNGIADGYSDGGFYPSSPVSRQAMASFLYRAADEPGWDWEAAEEFPDVPDDSQFWWPIQWMVTAGITGGYADGTFKPASPVTRQAMAVFLYRLAGSPVVELDGAPFPDVPATGEIAEAITWLAGTEVTGGYTDGNFRPGAAVSRQAMAAFIHRFVDKGLMPVPAAGAAELSPGAPAPDDSEPVVVAPGVVEGRQHRVPAEAP